ncbi:MAG: hypothetical protein ACTHKG_06855 [Nocardioides sp.]
MNPPSLPSVWSGVRPVNEPARTTAVLVCAGSAGVHLALVPEHLHESGALGAAFLLDGLLLAVAAVLLGDPARETRTTPAVAARLVATAGAYVLSRTSGIPWLLPDPEPLDALGAVTTVSELAGANACVLLTLRREPR